MSVTNRPELLALRRLGDAIDSDLVSTEALALLQWALASGCAVGPQVFEVVERDGGATIAAAIEVTVEAPETDGIERMRVVTADQPAYALRELRSDGTPHPLGDFDLDAFG